MQRFAVVSDIHGNLPALEAVLADAARHRVEEVINLGDNLSGPLWPSENRPFYDETRLAERAGQPRLEFTPS